MLLWTYSKKYNDSMYTQNHNVFSLINKIMSGKSINFESDNESDNE